MGSPYKALADGTRRGILKLLSKKDLTAGGIHRKLNMTKPAISAHFKILLEAGLVKVRKDRQYRIYSINKKKVKEVVKFVDTLL